MRTLDRSWERPAPTAAQLRADAFIGVGSAVIGVVSVELYRSASGSDVGWRGIEAYLWFGLAGLLLVGRRRLPLTTMVLVSALFVVIGERTEMFAAAFSIQVALFAAIYAAWAWSRHSRALYVVSVLVLVGMFGWLSLLLADPYPQTPEVGLLSPKNAAIAITLIVNVVYFFGAMAWGQAAWMSARRRASIEQQMERERKMQEDERELAVQAERVRIARDLHDVVAHHVSGIGVQAAGASRLMTSRPEAARDALGTIESSSRQAVTQMHQLVGLLREVDEARPAARGPQPGLEELEELVRSADSPRAEYRRVGEPFSIPPTVAVSLYRITQEALTNVRRHSGAKRVTVTLRFSRSDDGPPAVEIEVLDDGRGASPRREGSGGFGLTGIRERAAMHQGETEIGPRLNGGFRVRVRVPVEETS